MMANRSIIYTVIILILALGEIKAQRVNLIKIKNKQNIEGAKRNGMDSVFNESFFTDSSFFVELDGVHLLLERQRYVQKAKNQTYISGNVLSIDKEYLGHFSILQKESIISGRINYGGVQTTLFQKEGKLSMSSKKLENGSCDTKPNLVKDNTSSSLAKKEGEEMNLRASEASVVSDQNLQCNPNVVVSNVQIAFTPNAFATTGLDGMNSNPAMVQIRAEEIIESMNDAMANSNVGIVFRLVHSYLLNENESTNPNTDLAKDEDESFLRSRQDGVWDELWDKELQFQADIPVVITNTQYGGRAASDFLAFQFQRFFFYGYSDALFERGAAHEVGHIVDLEHHRASFSFWERVFLDSKSAYGFIGNNFKTIMVQTTEPGIHFHRYSDPNHSFPDGQASGDDEAQARNHAANSQSRAINPALSDKLPLEKVVVGNYSDNSYSAFVAKQKIIIQPGTKFDLGTSFRMEIKQCLP